MTRTEFPKPVGAPQLVVTHKSAYLLDAHVPNKVLLHVKAPKPGFSCWPSETEKKQGNWALSISVGIVTCTYADWDVYGKWRAELLPAGQEGNVVQVCNQGFVAQAPSLGTVFATILCLIIVAAGAMEVIALRDKIVGMDSRLQDLARRQPMGPGPQGVPGTLGASEIILDSFFTGGESGKEKEIPTFRVSDPPVTQKGRILPCTKPSDWDDELDGLWTPPLACLESTNKGSAAPAPADLASTFPLGMQLGSGESVTLGKITWELLDCRLLITHENAHVNYVSDGTSYSDHCVFVMQYDGNGVIYNKDKGSAVWATRDHLHRSCFYGLTADAATSDLYCQGPPPAPLPTVAPQPKYVPATKDTFKPGSFLRHGDGVKLGDYNLILVDCQLYLKNVEKMRPVPHQRQEEKTKTGCVLAMQLDGDLVMYHEKEGRLWSTSELWKENPEKCTKGVTVSTNGGIICQN
jgi:hypothetical protein